MKPDSRLQLRVQQFVADVTRLAHEVAVEGLRRATLATTPTPARTPRRGRAGRRSIGLGKGGRRPTGDVAQLATRFLAFVTSNPGLRIEQINQALGTKTSALRLPIAKLVAAGQLRTKGQRRSTTYAATT